MKSPEKNGTKHGHAFAGNASPTYNSWHGMKSRCLNPKDKRFHDYGGRGIKVCDRWKNSFSNFLSDMGNRPMGTSLDRFPDKNGGYEPGNCRWATPIEQLNNTRRNRLIKFYGKSLTVAQWARELKLPYERVHARVKRGWSIDRAFSSVITKAPPMKILAKYRDARRRVYYWLKSTNLDSSKKVALAIRDCNKWDKIIVSMNGRKRSPIRM